MAGSDAKRGSGSSRIRMSWVFILAISAFVCWKYWERRQDSAAKAKAAAEARVQGARLYLIGSPMAATSGNAVASAPEWRDKMGNFVRISATSDSSLALSGQLAGTDALANVIEAVLDESSLPAPVKTAGGTYTLPLGHIRRVTFTGSAQSADGTSRGTLSLQAMKAGPGQPPRLASGGVDWGARFRSFAAGGAEEIEATWTPDAGRASVFRLQRVR